MGEGYLRQHRCISTLPQPGASVRRFAADLFGTHGTAQQVDTIDGSTQFLLDNIDWDETATAHWLQIAKRYGASKLRTFVRAGRRVLEVRFPGLGHVHREEAPAGDSTDIFWTAEPASEQEFDEKEAEAEPPIAAHPRRSRRTRRGISKCQTCLALLAVFVVVCALILYLDGNIWEAGATRFGPPVPAGSPDGGPHPPTGL